LIALRSKEKSLLFTSTETQRKKVIRGEKGLAFQLSHG